MSNATVTLLAYSRNAISGDRLATFLIDNFSKPLIAEFNTHRNLSRNWESSRARPIAKVIEQVLNDPYIPNFTRNQKGMSGIPLTDSVEDQEFRRFSEHYCLQARNEAVRYVRHMISIDVAKQDANRYLEPWMKVSGIVSGTEWDNFIKLRTDPKVQPHLQNVACQIETLLNTKPKDLGLGKWHLPFPELSLTENVSKVASISYARHNKDMTLETATRIYTDLEADKHMSPFEHCAQAYIGCQTANYKGFQQLRTQLELKGA